MAKDMPVDDVLITQIGEWLGDEEGMHTTRPSLIARCLESVARETPRDLLQEWLQGLPAWDETPRLDDWLHDVAEAPKTTYGMAIARVLIVSMVARALDPGCIARYVIILEGEENTGKSNLVRSLASPEWYFAMTRDFESKEAHMDIQGAWVAELPELDSLGRTLETRLKAFITLREDSWIPKYANHRISSLRRTIFVGTINPEDPYLRGQTGNTRFLPIKTGAIDIPLFDAMREQLFAEAVAYYHAHGSDWWAFSEEALAEAAEAREVRRVVNEYEDLLLTWLRTLWTESIPTRLRTTTTWQEIAEKALRIESPERWKDKALQMQIAQAMRAIGWRRVKKRAPPDGVPVWLWEAPPQWEQVTR
jgi:putative DNA primase/helicase